jgi:hypothetical protein
MEKGGKTITATSSQTITIDGSAPTATNFAPPPNGTTHDRRHTILAMFDDGQGTGINTKSIRLWVNEQDVTKDTKINAGQIEYKPKQDFKTDEVKVHLQLADQAKNVTDYNWTFSIEK